MNTPPEPVFTAYRLNDQQTVHLVPADIDRAWMDGSPNRFAYRCLPLAIANQCGWVLTCPCSFALYWYGGPLTSDLELRFDGPPDNTVQTHFGSGVLTFTVPFLFRTPPGVNLWVKGPANSPKDGIQALEGVVETDWSASTFTMNWKVTRAFEWVRFEKGEPFCMLVPVPRGLAEGFLPRIERIEANPALHGEYQRWEAGRRGFLQGLKELDPGAVKQGWQKDYFKGKTPDGRDIEEHQTRLRIREFTEGAG